MHRYTLANGLRVVLAPDTLSPRVGIAVHYGVGFRGEDRAGFAHLFEHLMFRGSASLPNGAFHDHLIRYAGESGGTTRQDHTEYFQKIPTAALEPALFADADRMRAPLFTEDTVREQLDGVAQEITGTVDTRTLGGFPWPALPAAAFQHWANAHDGYGRAADLLTATPEECAAFFHRHYAPGNAVLTITGAIDLATTTSMIQRHFGDLPARPTPPTADPTEPPWREDVWREGTEPGVDHPAIALAHRLPDPRTDLDGYLTTMVLAELLTTSPTPATSTCGFFEPLAARDPDSLVTSALLPDGLSPTTFLATVRSHLRHADPTALTAAATRLATRHQRAHADPLRLARSAGAAELLFARPALPLEIPDLLRALPPQHLRRAAQDLADTPCTALVLLPGPTRTRPEPTAPAPAGQPATTPTTAHRPRPRPTGTRPDRFTAPHFTSTDLDGIHLVTATDHRTPLVELRLRIPLGPDLWARPGRDRQLARAIARHLTTTQVTSDGQFLRLGAVVSPAAAGTWLAAVSTALTSFGGPPWDHLPPPPAPGPPHEFLDTAASASCLLGTTPTSTATAPGPAGAQLTAVGPVDPTALATTAQDALGLWRATPAHPTPPDPPEPGPPLVIPTSGRSSHLTLWTPEPPTGDSEAARHLATAALGGHPTARLVRGALARDGKGYLAYAGRDTFLGAPRVFIRATLPAERVDEALAGVAEDLRQLAADPPTDAELAAVADYCVAQLPSAFDSPQTLADLLDAVVTAQRGPDWLTEAVPALHATTPDEIRKAGTNLFATPLFHTLVLQGSTG